MRDIKPRNEKMKVNKITKNSQNSSDVLIKKVVIAVLILVFVGVVIFYFAKENKGSAQTAIEENTLENDLEETTISEAIPSEETSVEQSEEIKASILTSAEAKQIIETKAEQSVTAIKNKDFKTVAELMHSEHKLTFSPYANFNNKNQSFSQDEVKGLFSDSTKYNWGEYNGLAVGAIEMSFSDYYELFIYDQDYVNAEKISYNENLNNGKIKNNSQNFFENSITVKYYFSGFDPELKEKGMDWRSLRLVFVEIDGEWYLRGISHDELTI